MVIEYTIHPDVLAAAMREWAEIDAFLQKRNLPRSALNYTHWAAGDVMPGGQQVMLAPRFSDEPIMSMRGEGVVEVRLKMSSIETLAQGINWEFARLRGDYLDRNGDLIVHQTVLVLRLAGQPMPTPAETAAYTQLIADREAREQAKPSAEWLAQIAARQEKPRE